MKTGGVLARVSQGKGGERLKAIFVPNEDQIGLGFVQIYLVPWELMVCVKARKKAQIGNKLLPYP